MSQPLDGPHCVLFLAQWFVRRCTQRTSTKGERPANILLPNCLLLMASDRNRTRWRGTQIPNFQKTSWDLPERVETTPTELANRWMYPQVWQHLRYFPEFAQALGGRPATFENGVRYRSYGHPPSSGA
jgi:hypothetical protein